MKKIIGAVVVMMVALGGFAVAQHRGPSGERAVREDPIQAVNGPVREIVFEPDVIVAYETDRAG